MHRHQLLLHDRVAIEQVEFDRKRPRAVGLQRIVLINLSAQRQRTFSTGDRDKGLRRTARRDTKRYRAYLKVCLNLFDGRYRQSTLSEPTIVMTRERVLGYDVARALAILGMLLVHFGYVMSAPGWQETNWSTVMASLDGRSAATFIMLVGVGMTLRTSRAANQNGDVALRQVRRTFIRRGIYLLVFGTLLLVIWPGEILRLYGVAMLIACCFITAPRVGNGQPWLDL